MKISYHKNFKKNYQKRILPHPKLVTSSEKRLKLLINNPNHPLLKDHKLIGVKGNLRSFSVTGDIRVVYKFVKKDKVLLYDIGTHNQVY